MPLVQLLSAPGGGAASGTAKPKEPKEPPPRAPQAQDVSTLLVHVLLAVQQGAPLCLATVKAAWRQLAFSHVFEVRPLGGGWWLACHCLLLLLPLYAAVLSCDKQLISATATRCIES